MLKPAKLASSAPQTRRKLLESKVGPPLAHAPLKDSEKPRIAPSMTGELASKWKIAFETDFPRNLGIFSRSCLTSWSELMTFLRCDTRRKKIMSRSEYQRPYLWMRTRRMASLK